MKKNYVLTFCFTITLFLFFHQNLFSKSSFNNIQKIDVRDGISSDEIYTVIKDKYNFIWIGTNNGLNRFDGINVRQYHNNKFDDSSLSNNLIQSLCYDSISNSLWIATDKGICKYNYEKDNFIRYYYHDTDSTINFNDIISIKEFDSESLLILSYYAGIFRMDKSTGEIYWFDKTTPDPDINKSRKLLCFSQDKYKNIWVGSSKGELYKYYSEENKIDTFNIDINSECKINSVFIDNNQNIICGTINGLFIKYNDSDKFTKVSFISKNISVYDINIINNNQLWIGTESGVFIFDNYVDAKQINNTNFIHISESTNDSGLSFKSVRSIYEDQYNNIWISTFGGGLNYIPSIKPNFHSIKRKSEDNLSLKYTKILSCSTDSLKNIYLGTDGNGICIMDSIHQIKEYINFNETGLNDNLNIIQTLLFDKDIIWAGTYTGGLIRYNVKTKSKRIINTSNSSIICDDIRVIKKNPYKNDTYWVSGINGFMLIDNNGNIIEKYTNKYGNFVGGYIIDIEFVNENNIWLSIYNGGLALFNYRTKKFKYFTSEANDKFSLSDNMISDIYFSSDKKLWIATRNNGLKYYDIHKELFLEPKSVENIPMHILNITEDANGMLWLCQFDKLSKYNPKTGDIENYESKSIKEVAMFRSSADLNINGEKIYFGGNNGLVWFEPSKVNTNINYAVKPIFTDFKLFNNPVIISNDTLNTCLTKSILTEDKIVLEHDESVITIHYISPSYGNIDDVKYAYMLDGEDKNWTKAGAKTFAEYRNLSPGKYTFKVMATTNDDFFNSDITKLDFEIKSPLWLTWPMYIIYALFVIFIVYITMKVLTYRYKTYNKLKFLRLERDKTEELYQSKLQFFTNISHEFRTPLTLITAPIDKLEATETDPDRKFILSLMKKNSQRLLRLINQILDLRRIDRGGLKLNISEGNLIDTLNDIFISFNEFSVVKNIDFNFEYDKGYNIFYDKEIINHCIYNLLSNAFKFTPENGAVKLKVYQTKLNSKNYLSLEISDTGIGISNEDIDKIFDRFYMRQNSKSFSQGSGIGLHLVKELVELHKGVITVKSNIGQGTTFIIYIPLNYDVYQESDYCESALFLDVDKESNKFTYPDKLVINDNINQTENKSDNKKKSKTILIVDDESDIVMYLKHALESKYNILTASDGVQGLEIVRSNYVDLILTDVMMPRMTGIELCTIIKNDLALCHIPVIILTAKNVLSSQLDGLGAGADDYIVKPFNLEYLMIKIESVFNQLERLKNQLRCNYSLDIKDIDLQNNTNIITTKEDDGISESEKEKITIKQNRIGKMNEDFIAKATQVVIANIDNDNFNSEILASEMNLSRVHLHRKLKMIMDETTTEFIKKVRLKEAERLMREGSLNISEISYATGFSSPAYFTVCFSKLFGLSPKEYMSKHKILDHENKV